MSKWTCEECGKECADGQVLRAPNPFKPDEEISGCPNCLEVESLAAACCVDGCGEPMAGGMLIDSEYVWLCQKHHQEEFRKQVNK